MDLAKLIVPSKTVDMEYPRFEGLTFKVAYLTRDELQKLRESATSQKFSRKTRQTEEEVDSELFQDLYIKAVVKGWSGFKYKYLRKLLPIDEGNIPPEEFKDGEGDFGYSTENAIVLMKNCSDFDTWISTLLEDVENFTQNS